MDQLRSMSIVQRISWQFNGRTYDALSVIEQNIADILLKENVLRHGDFDRLYDNIEPTNFKFIQEQPK